jgi:hypothetical protein
VVWQEPEEGFRSNDTHNHLLQKGRVIKALSFILVRLRITDRTIELDADVGFCELQEVHRGKKYK